MIPYYVFITTVLIVGILAWYEGYNNAIDDIKATGRIPELEDLCNTNTTKTE